MKNFTLFILFSLIYSVSISAQCDISGVAITSVLVDPNGANNFDTDGDGNFESDDEYIEICNTSGATVDISGWTLGDDDSNGLFTFPAATSLAPGECAQLVRDWDAAGALPAGVFDMDNGNAFLANGGDKLLMSDGTSTCEVVYGSASCDVGATNCDDWGADTDGCPLLASGPDCSHVPLPVELVSFNATLLENKTVELTWETATELNNAHFEIQKSTDGERFQSIGLVEGAGTTTETQSYGFIDTELSLTNYYRLKQVDFDGAFEYSEVLVVRLNKSNTNYEIFPNPVSNQLNINLGNEFGDVTFNVLDITGKIVLSESRTAEGIQAINTKSLIAGVYFLNVITSGEQSTVRFIKK